MFSVFALSVVYGEFQRCRVNRS